MGYLLLGVSLFAGATKGFCGKKMGNFATNTTSAALLNLIRMALCILFGIILILLQNHLGFLSLSPEVILISMLSGVTTSVFVVTWLICVRKSAYMMLDVFLMLGVLVPMILGKLIFKESITTKQWIGFCVLVLASTIMCSYNNSIKSKITVSSLIMLFICGFANGLTDFSQKAFVKMLPNIPISIFNLYTYVFAFLTLLIFLVFMTKKEKPAFEQGSKNEYLYVVIMAIALIANTYFKTMSARYLDSAVLYPLSSGSALIVSSFMSSVFFKEKLSVKAIIGIIMSFIGLLIMNVL